MFKPHYEWEQSKVLKPTNTRKTGLRGLRGWLFLFSLSCSLWHASLVLNVFAQLSLSLSALPFHSSPFLKNNKPCAKTNLSHFLKHVTLKLILDYRDSDQNGIAILVIIRFYFSNIYYIFSHLYKLKAKCKIWHDLYLFLLNNFRQGLSGSKLLLS